MLERITAKLKSLIWAIKIAWKIDKQKLLVWFGLGGILAILPSISIFFNKQLLAYLSCFADGSKGIFSEIIPSLFGYGIIMSFIAISARVNNDLIYMMMYDSYYLGMLETAMDKIPEIKMETLLEKDINDKYNFTIWRPGALTDIMSSLCQLSTKLISITAMLIIARSTSIIAFHLTLAYVAITILVNVILTKDDRFTWDVVMGIQRKAGYYENLPYQSGIAKEIRMFRNSEKIIEQWKKQYSIVEKFHLDKYKDEKRRNFVSDIVFFLTIIGIIFFSLLKVSRHEMTPDTFLILYFLCMSIYRTIAGLAQDIMILDRGIQAADNQRRFYSMPIFTESDKNNQEGMKREEQTVFKAENIRFCYNDRMVIDDVSFTIKKGEIVALVGKNGSGKTTLTKLLLGMYTPKEGKMWFFGVPYEEITIPMIRKYIGVFFQNFFIFHHTVQENVGYGDVNNWSNEQLVLDAIHKGGAKDIICKMSNGIKSILKRDVDKNGINLSGGESQRIAVSRTHMSNREVLIFDEPAAMLDPLGEMEQFYNIKDKIQGRTAILISHRVGFARLADKIIMMDKGKIVEQGTHDELMKKRGAYAQFFYEQAKWYQ